MRINEITQPAIDQAIDVLERECGPYLQEIGGIENALVHKPLYRGSGDKFPSDSPIIKVPVRQDRRPRNTGIRDHERADEWFKENSSYGIPYRSASLFCSGSSDTAAIYARRMNGAVSIVLPVGEYHYCWAPDVEDMTEGLDGMSWSLGEIIDIKNFLDDASYIEDRNLAKAVASGHEIMLHCKEAILIQQTFIDDFLYSSWRKK